ncbi:MAG: hypothetical protein UHN88_04090 [Eubacterium sp.]|nr:hypothetical protein [Eubacterium sp.]
MSQEKVNAYKEEKRNRKKIMKREKITRALGIIAALVVVVAAVVWFSMAVYSNAKANAAANTANVTTEMDLTGMNDYSNYLSSYNTAE